MDLEVDLRSRTSRARSASAHASRATACDFLVALISASLLKFVPSPGKKVKPTVGIETRFSSNFISRATKLGFLILFHFFGRIFFKDFLADGVSVEKMNLLQRGEQQEQLHHPRHNGHQHHQHQQRHLMQFVGKKTWTEAMMVDSKEWFNLLENISI